MLSPYEEICRLKLIIDRSTQFKERLMAAFDYTKGIGTSTPEFLSNHKGRTRKIFGNFENTDLSGTNLQPKIPPVILKTVAGNSSLPYDLNKRKGEEESLRFLYAELGALERFGEWHWVPGFFGIVISREHALAGILMEDVSLGGRREYEATETDGYQVLRVNMGDRMTMDCYIDLKPFILDNFLENRAAGVKYLSPDALIEL